MGFSHLHFIQTIKGGLVVNIFNADSSRSPELKFKSVKAIYESEDTVIPGCRLVQHLVEGMVTDSQQFGSGAANSKVPLLRRSLRHVKCEPETCELDDNGVDSQKKSGLDENENGTGEMTLKEMKECFKKQKKKFQKSDLLSKKYRNVLSSLGDGSSKQVCNRLLIEEKETDLEEPLITWKLKRKNKTKRKSNSTGVHLSSKIAVSSEQILGDSQDLSQDLKKIQAPINIKIEISESASTCFSNGSTSEDCNGIDFHTESSDGEQKVVDRNDMRNMEPNLTCITSSSTLEYCEKNDFVRESFSEEPNIVDEGDTENLQPASLTKVSQNCVTNEASFEYSELGKFMPAPLGDKFLFEENVEIGPLLMTNCGSSAAETSPVTNNLGCDASSSIDSSDSIITYNSDLISCQLNWNLIQWPINKTLQCVRPNYNDGRCVPDLKSEVATGGDNNHLNEIGTCDGGSPSITCQDSQPSFRATYGTDPVSDDSSTGHEKHFFLATDESVSGGVDGTLDCSRENLGLDAREGSANMAVLQNNDGLCCQAPPARIFLKRKVISPTSQEKLCKAMDIGGLYDDDENFKSGLTGFEATINPKLVFKKPKNRKSGSPRSAPKGILKASHSFLVPHEGTDCSSSHGHAQKAIAFSQRQMHDIECLAMKLLNELKIMKEIMEETWNSTRYSSIPPKYTSDELRMTIENAGEVEETTKKWLSMMARDCNRFCKIMRSNEKTAASPGHSLHKQRKKITFADESGGVLCHVKVFEDHPTTPLVLEGKPAYPDTRS